MKENIDIKAQIESLPPMIRRGIQQFVWWEIARHRRYPADSPFADKHNRALEEVLCSEEIEASHEIHAFHELHGDIKILADEIFELFCYIIHQMDSGASEEAMPERYEQLAKKYPKAYDRFCLTVWG